MPDANQTNHDESRQLTAQLQCSDAYHHRVDSAIEIVETHISWVVLAGAYAYKIKKPISTGFLDYSSLPKRHEACIHEVELGVRYAPHLYLKVVAITDDTTGLHVDGEGRPIEFAVQMHRFPPSALLSRRLEENLTNPVEMIQLGHAIAQMHLGANIVYSDHYDLVASIGRQAFDNFDYLQKVSHSFDETPLAYLQQWTRQAWQVLHERFRYRLQHGWVRQCHGDLHTDNVIYWQDKWSAFDGIEFNAELSQIDVISDIAFLVMDLTHRGHNAHAVMLLNAYLESTGDYHGLLALQWYLVYRSIVRAKVAAIRAAQFSDHADQARELDHVRQYLYLAQSFTRDNQPRLWITHGLSGSGKTTGSQQAIAEHQFIRLRSDVERKRLFSSRLAASSTNEPQIGAGLYDSTVSAATYQHLWSLSRELLMAGFNVLVDAAFLQLEDRQRFQVLAEQCRAEFGILHFEADVATLRERIAARQRAGNDASDATCRVLDHQLRTQQPLTPAELRCLVSAPR